MIVTNVPMFTIDSRDIMRRFILLVDELYNRKVKLICTATTGIQDLFTADDTVYDEAFAFERTISRLTEMQTKEYMEAAHEPNL